MDVLRIRPTASLQPRHVVMLSLMTIVLAGSGLFLSAAESTTLVDGAVEWQAQSPLRAVVKLLCLNYQHPTIHPGAIKVFFLGLGAGLSILFLGIAVLSRDHDEPTADENADAASHTAQKIVGDIDRARRIHIAPLIAAQAMFVMYLLWSFASSRWSAAPELAIGGTILLSIQVLWAFGLGFGLSTHAVKIATRIVVAVMAITAIMAVWYYYGRNPTLRAKFPFGNPTLLSATLIPGLLLAAAMTADYVIQAVSGKGVKALLKASVVLAALAVGSWALVLADSRASQAGLALGFLAMCFFYVRGRWKLIPAALAIVSVTLGAWLFVQRMNEPSATGRDVTLRVRRHAWTYAWHLWRQRPVAGHGQGGFVRLGDRLAAGDVLDDPQPFQSRIAHAHSEWLEILADLGVIGIALIGLGLFMTIRAAMHLLASAREPPRRWIVAALLGALVALMVEESASVGLRISGVATMFYTVIGLLWAQCSERRTDVLRILGAARTRRVATGIVAGTLGVIALIITQQDFAAARAAWKTRLRLAQHATGQLADSEYDETLRIASSAQDRLNPQRALAGLFRLADAHLMSAQRFLARGTDRATRAQRMQPPDVHLLELAQLDFRVSHQHCIEGVARLKELVYRAPGYFNNGSLDYELNLTLASNPLLADQHDQYLDGARDAIERELLRQPFNQRIALQYAWIADAAGNPDELITTLARPLRYARIKNEFVSALEQASRATAFVQALFARAGAARESFAGAVDDESDAPGQLTADDPWAPEVLRIAATLSFLRGSYAGARSALEAACQAYDRQIERAPLAAASCYMELAHCRFYDHPEDGEAALDAAQQAIAHAPPSWQGRELVGLVRYAMVDYYLAANREPEALEALRIARPSHIPESAVPYELGARYRKLCQSMLRRRQAPDKPKPPKALQPRLQRWIERALELETGEPAGYLLAADLAYHGGDPSLAVERLREGLKLGLPKDVVMQFLTVALQGRPSSAPLLSLWRELEPDRPAPSKTPERDEDAKSPEPPNAPTGSNKPANEE